jgi:pantoate--beta-alanine ligase
LADAGVTAVFLPNKETMYPDDYRYQVAETELSCLYCGAHRAGHFDGVLSVVMKLFNLAQPTRAYFGEKDYQQLTLIQGMVQAFFMSIEIVPCPVVRESDGLAMSSRNLRLSPIERKIAPQLYATLTADTSLADKRQRLADLGFDLDYLEVYQDRLLVAAKLGEIRLIDNVPLPAGAGA